MESKNSLIVRNMSQILFKPERHDIKGGHEDKHMKVRDKFWELRILELTDVSCKGIEVLARQNFIKKT